MRLLGFLYMVAIGLWVLWFLYLVAMVCGLLPGSYYAVASVLCVAARVFASD